MMIALTMLNIISFSVYHGAYLNSSFRIITLTLALIVMMLALMTCVSKMSLKLWSESSNSSYSLLKLSRWYWKLMMSSPHLSTDIFKLSHGLRQDAELVILFCFDRFGCSKSPYVHLKCKILARFVSELGDCFCFV